MIYNRVQETSTTSGTGSLTLAGAETGFQTFNSAIGTDVRAVYWISDSTANVWETGVGYLSSSTVLVRETVTDNSSGTTSALSLAGNSVTVYTSINSNTSSLYAFADATKTLIQASSRYLAISSSSFTATSGTLYINPFEINQQFTANYMRIRTNSLTDATYRMVIFEGSRGFPGQIVGDTGDVTSTSFGAKALSLTSPVLLMPGMYYVGIKFWGLDSVGAGGGALECYRHNTADYSGINPLGRADTGAPYTGVNFASSVDNVIANAPGYIDTDLVHAIRPAIFASGD